jgi:hypothetical protein
LKLKNYREDPNEFKNIKDKNVLIDVVNGGFTKRSPRNSILPYSVFEDYLLFKCYLDKSDDHTKNNVRTRQSGHLGREGLLTDRFPEGIFGKD